MLLGALLGSVLGKADGSLVGVKDGIELGTTDGDKQLLIIISPVIFLSL
jgi:hypothetical protein